MQTVFISRGLNHTVVERNKLTTSSQKFELEFIKAYSKLSPVTVVYIGNKPCEDKVEINANFRLVCSRYRNLFGVIRRITGGEKAIVFATGYDPRTIGVMILLKLLGCRCYSFIYDTHKLYAADKPFVRRSLINLFFGVGLNLARFITGWLVLNDGFIKKGKWRIGYLKVRVGASLPNSLVDFAEMSDKSAVVFLLSGTLNEDNGTKLLLEAVRTIERDGFELHIYGYGPLSELVRSYSKEDRRIRFFGAVDNDLVLQKQREADFLIHLRDPSSIAVDVAYPSKLIEYLCSGRPVLSNVLPGIGDDVAESIVPIEAYGRDGIRRAILDVLDGSVTPPAREQIFARLRNRRGWDAIALEVASFVQVNSSVA